MAKALAKDHTMEKPSQLSDSGFRVTIMGDAVCNTAQCKPAVPTKAHIVVDFGRE